LGRNGRGVELKPKEGRSTQKNRNLGTLLIWGTSIHQNAPRERKNIRPTRQLLVEWWKGWVGEREKKTENSSNKEARNCKNVQNLSGKSR